MKKNKFRKLLVFILVFAWLFTGWPPVWQNPRIPPKIKEAQAAVTYFNSSSLPADNGAQDGVPTPSITPPLDMLAGDLAIIVAQGRGAYTLAISQAGGQTWATETAFTTTNLTARIFWCIFDGTWDANPSVSGVANNIAETMVMHVFRPSNGSNTWAIDVAQTTGTFSAPSTPFTVTIGGVNTQTNGAVVVATWAVPLANTWGTLAGSGWSVLGSAQYRNTQGSDQSITFAYNIVATAGPSGNVSKNESAGTAGATSIIAFKEVPITTLGNGVSEPDNTTIGPGDGATDLDNFTLVTSSGIDTVIAATVSLGPTDAFNNIAQVDITDTANTAKCTAVSGLSSNTVTFNTCNIPASTASTTYKIRITPKTHPNMPAVPGASYATTGTVTDITCTNSKSLNDSGSATVIVDNASPGNVSGIGGTAGNQQVQLNWTNPGDSSSVLVLHRANIAVGNTPPTEGDTYIVSDPIGSSTVACVENSPSASCTDTSLINNTPYHYKVFAKDSRGNYDAGTVPSGSPFTPFLVSISITDGMISFGMVGLGKSAMSTSDAEIISVDQGPADLDIRSTGFIGVGYTWILNDTSGDNKVKWEYSKNGGSWSTFLVADSLYPFDTSVGVGETRNAYFKITIPTFTDSYEQYGTTVTVVASSP